MNMNPREKKQYHFHNQECPFHYFVQLLYDHQPVHCLEICTTGKNPMNSFTILTAMKDCYSN